MPSAAVIFIVLSIQYAAERMQDQVSIICGNALESNLSSATAVFMYLLPKGMARLLQKLQAELQPGCKVITYMFRYASDTDLISLVRLLQVHFG